MNKTRILFCVRLALMSAFLSALTNNAIAGSFTRSCAARDIQVLNLIEERENAGAISTQKSVDAILTMMHARMVCFEGRALDALTLYESISQSAAPNPLLSDRRE